MSKTLGGCSESVYIPGASKEAEKTAMSKTVEEMARDEEEWVVANKRKLLSLLPPPEAYPTTEMYKKNTEQIMKSLTTPQGKEGE